MRFADVTYCNAIIVYIQRYITGIRRDTVEFSGGRAASWSTAEQEVREIDVCLQVPGGLPAKKMISAQ